MTLLLARKPDFEAGVAACQRSFRYLAIKLGDIVPASRDLRIGSLSGVGFSPTDRAPRASLRSYRL
jgi:hypothetical protein